MHFILHQQDMYINSIRVYLLMDRNDEGWQADDVLIPIQVITMFSRKLNGTGKISPVFILYQENSYFYTEPGVMYKTIFVINIIIYMCLQHSNVL